MWGCHAPVRQPHVYPGDPPISLCPLKLFDRIGPKFEHQVFTYHMNWKVGIMPEAGGLADQASAYPAAMVAVEGGINAAQNYLQERNKREHEKKTYAGYGPRRRGARS